MTPEQTYPTPEAALEAAKRKKDQFFRRVDETQLWFKERAEQSRIVGTR